MLVAYDSRAGKVKKFVEKLNLRAVQIQEGTAVNEPFVFVTYTDGAGEVPKMSEEFLQRCHEYLVAVAASGNKVFPNFAKSADVISEKYNVPVINKFEFDGKQRDVNIVKEWLSQNAPHTAQQ